MNTLTKYQVSKYFHYEKDKGILVWKDHYYKSKKRFLGKEAGKKNSNPYKEVTFKGAAYMVHRIIWFIEKNEWPEMIDHIDGNKANNHISNLRRTTNRFNQHNRVRHRKGKLVGAHWRKREGFWTSKIRVNKIPIHLGCFLTEQAAHERYMQELKTRGIL